MRMTVWQCTHIMRLDQHLVAVGTCTLKTMRDQIPTPPHLLVWPTNLHLDTFAVPEEVGQLIRRIWAKLSTNQIAPFSSCSHEAFGIENLHMAHKYRLFSYCYAHFFGNFTRYYFYNSQSTHWNGVLKGKRYFPVYFDLSL
jgi:hypothetical protein